MPRRCRDRHLPRGDGGHDRELLLCGVAAGFRLATLLRTNVGREINRYSFTETEVWDALEDPAVTELLDLYRWRNREPVFEGNYSLDETDDAHMDFWR